MRKRTRPAAAPAAAVRSVRLFTRHQCVSAYFARCWRPISESSSGGLTRQAPYLSQSSPGKFLHHQNVGSRCVSVREFAKFVHSWMTSIV